MKPKDLVPYLGSPSRVSEVLRAVAVSVSP